MITDEIFMEKALELANESFIRNEVPVGALIVKDGKIIATSSNRRESSKLISDHAEFICIQEANKKLKSWNLSGTTLYVTKEPCLMCSGAIMQSRISRVVIGCLSPKDGCIISKIKVNDLSLNHKIDITSGTLEKECAEVLKNFFRIRR